MHTTPHIYSFGYKSQGPGRGLILDARHLPNPHDIPALRIPDGTSPRVSDWLAKHDEVKDFIASAINRIDREQPTAIWIGCNAGKHRSVYVAEQLAHHYGTTANHMTLHKKRRQPPRNQQTYRHQRARERTKRMMQDGEPCWWCGRPMHHNQLLHADHTTSVKNGGMDADRMMHDKCNRQRREGGPGIDERRPALAAANAFPMLPILLMDGSEDPRYPCTNTTTRPPERPAMTEATRPPFAWREAARGAPPP